jgi:hypothetical protein
MEENAKIPNDHPGTDRPEMAREFDNKYLCSLRAIFPRFQFSVNILSGYVQEHQCRELMPSLKFISSKSWP